MTHLSRWLSAVCLGGSIAWAAAPSRPNVIVIMADDLGYECLAVNGSKQHLTPNVDRLAAEGVRFTQCYAQPNCTPTRVQLMTGMYNVRNYTAFGHLDPSQTTFGHVFRQARYATAIAGKWQLGAKEKDLPRHFGFDEHCLWAYMGRGERYSDPKLTLNGMFQTMAGSYGPDVCQDFAIDFVRRHRDQPFILYYPMILVHGGFEATPDSADYRQATAKTKGKAIKQRHFNEMVTYMDKLVGRLTAELDALGLRERTLLLFTGDNGTPRGLATELADGNELEGEKGNTTRAGMHVPLIGSWPGRLAKGIVCNDLIDMTDFLPTLCAATSVPLPADRILDGRSFLPQLLGQTGQPKDSIYSYWVPLKQFQSTNVGSRGAVEQAFDQRFKLYSTGAFFDSQIDPEETKPQRVADLADPMAVAAARKLQATLNQYQDARPEQLPEPKKPRAKKPAA